MKGVERKKQRLVDTETRENSEQDFEAYRATIKSSSVSVKILPRYLNSDTDLMVALYASSAFL